MHKIGDLDDPEGTNYGAPVGYIRKEHRQKFFSVHPPRLPERQFIITAEAKMAAQAIDSAFTDLNNDMPLAARTPQEIRDKLALGKQAINDLERLVPQLRIWWDSVCRVGQGISDEIELEAIEAEIANMQARMTILVREKQNIIQRSKSVDSGDGT